MGCYIAIGWCYIVLCGAMQQGPVLSHAIERGGSHGAIWAIGAIYGYIPNVFFS